MTEQLTPEESASAKLAALQAELAELRGVSVEEIVAMSVEEMTESMTLVAFNTLGMHVATKHVDHLIDYDIREQSDRARAALERFHRGDITLFPVHTTGEQVNLFGFGRAAVWFIAIDSDDKTVARYLLLSEAAEQLGIPLHKADEWAHRDQDDALRAQRERDEERGELGWECLRDLINLDLSLIIDNPEANPDGGGRRWSCAGDWLISTDRILALMTLSPWNREFLDNSSALWGHAFRSAFGDKLADSPVYDREGRPTGNTALDLLGNTEGLSAEEAAKRAIRGPVGPLDDAP